MISFPRVGSRKPVKKTYPVDRDAARRYSVVLRHWKWRSLKDDPHHLGAVAGVGPLTGMGLMTQAHQLGTLPTDFDAVRMIAFHYDTDESEGFKNG